MRGVSLGISFASRPLENCLLGVLCLRCSGPRFCVDSGTSDTAEGSLVMN